MKINAHLKQLAERLNITVMVERSLNDIPWKGDMILRVPNKNTNSNLAHELAHYLVASSSRRLKRNFGLGRDPETGIQTSRVVSNRFAHREEEACSLLGIMMEQYLKLNYNVTALDHNWHDDKWCRINSVSRYKQGKEPLNVPDRAIKILLKKKLIQPNYTKDRFEPTTLDIS